MTPRHQNLNLLIHQPTRLAIMAALAAAREIEFAALHSTLQVSDSLLSRYVSMLEKAKLISVRKGFVGKRPRTWIRITSQGRTAFEVHVATLLEIIRNDNESK